MTTTPKPKRRVIKRKVFNGRICSWQVYEAKSIEDISQSFMTKCPPDERHFRQRCRITVEVYEK